MAPRRPATPSMPQRPELLPPEIRKCIARLEKRIGELKDFDPSKIMKRYDNPDVDALEIRIAEALQAAFGHGTVEYNRYRGAANLDQGAVIMGGGNPFGGGGYDQDHREEGQRYLAEGKARSLALLQTAVDGLKEELDDAGGEIEATAPASDRRVRLNHNSAPYSELVTALEVLMRALQGVNDHPDDDLKEQQVAELSAGRELLKSMYVRTKVIWNVISVPLRYLIKEFAGKEVGHLADAAWKYFTTLFGL